MNKLHWTPPDEPCFGSQKPRSFWCMENTTTRSAYWCSWIERNGPHWLVVWWFGRIGAFGKKGYKQFNGELAAHAWMNAKRSEKESNGYEFKSACDNFVVQKVSAKPPAFILDENHAETVPFIGPDQVVSVHAKPIAEVFDPLGALWD